MPRQRLEKIKELSKSWNRIEGRLKQAESARREVVHAAVNELRYAGRTMVDIWTISHEDASEDQLQLLDDKIAVVEQYLHNSNHDITDGVCFVLHSKVHELLELVPRRKIRKDFPHLDEFLGKLQEAHDIVTKSRETRHDRVEQYNYLEKEYIPYLLDNFALLDHAERMAEVKLKRARWITTVSLAFGVIGFIGSLASIISVDMENSGLQIIIDYVSGWFTTSAEAGQ